MVLVPGIDCAGVPVNERAHVVRLCRPDAGHVDRHAHGKPLSEQSPAEASPIVGEYVAAMVVNGNR